MFLQQGIQMTGPEVDGRHNKRARGNIIYRTLCVSSDDEAKRGDALVKLLMNQDLHPDSPISPLLSPLELMNLRVGEDDMMADKDYRHVLKTIEIC
ncbi:hypothetical protein B0H13DRAFT_2306110 [Mycena leptocephala]|nr:hypothetical protein B0H13DRAFT_2306110 [Mycena leptocephala]